MINYFTISIDDLNGVPSSYTGIINLLKAKNYPFTLFPGRDAKPDNIKLFCSLPNDKEIGLHGKDNGIIDLTVPAITDEYKPLVNQNVIAWAHGVIDPKIILNEDVIARGVKPDISHGMYLFDQYNTQGISLSSSASALPYALKKIASDKSKVNFFNFILHNDTGVLNLTKAIAEIKGTAIPFSNLVYFSKQAKLRG